MRFKLGLAIGFAAGYWLGVQADEERKRQVTEAVDKVREDPRVQRVSSAVSENARRITEAVEDRIAPKTNGGGEAAATAAESAASGSGAQGSSGRGTGTG